MLTSSAVAHNGVSQRSLAGRKSLAADLKKRSRKKKHFRKKVLLCCLHDWCLLSLEHHINALVYIWNCIIKNIICILNVLHNVKWLGLNQRLSAIYEMNMCKRYLPKRSVWRVLYSVIWILLYLRAAFRRELFSRIK